MRSFSFVIFIFGLLIFVVASFIPPIIIGGIQFDVKEEILEISATLFSLFVLTSIYKLFGEEPTIKMLMELREMQNVSKVLSEAGVKAFAVSRSKFDITQIHQNTRNATEAFIVARNFTAIKHGRVRDLFRSMLKDKKKRVRILVKPESLAKQDLIDYKSSLPLEMQKRFDLRENSNIMHALYGSNQSIYVTFYVSGFSGDESPSILCVKQDGEALYNIFYREYLDLWDTGTKIS